MMSFGREPYSKVKLEGLVRRGRYLHGHHVVGTRLLCKFRSGT